MLLESPGASISTPVFNPFAWPPGALGSPPGALLPAIAEDAAEARLQLSTFCLLPHVRFKLREASGFY